MSRPLRILHTVENYLPYRCGMQEVVTRISEGLVELGHQVTVATSKNASRDFKSLNGVEIREFGIDGNQVRGYRWGEIQDYLDFLKSGNFDIVVNFAAQQWATDLTFTVLDQIKAKKVLVPTGYSGLFSPEYIDYFKELPGHLGKYDKVIYHSHEYQDFFFSEVQGLANHTVIPNGASAEEFSGGDASFNLRQYLKIPQDYKVVLSVGNHTAMKGHQEAFSIFSKAKIEKVALVIVGTGHPRFGCHKFCHSRSKLFNKFPWVKYGDGKSKLLSSLFSGFFSPSVWGTSKCIHAVELSREQLISAFKQSDLFLFPSLIECYPIVLVEALAAGLPIIASEAGASREIVKLSKAGVTLPTLVRNPILMMDLDASAKILEEALTQWDLKEMRKVALQQWAEHFQWEKIVGRYENVYQSLFESSS